MQKSEQLNHCEIEGLCEQASMHHIRLGLNGETINNSNNSLITVYEMVLLHTRSANSNREIRSIAIELQTQRHIIGFYCFSLIASNIGFN